MDVRLDRVSRSVVNFFENDLSGNFLGLPQSARDHFDRFRSFLHTFYIEQHGFWPPDDFESESNQRRIYAVMYSDFRNLYHHLVEPKSSIFMAENDINMTGGVCAMQNVQAFDARHHYDALPRPLPMIPNISANGGGLSGPRNRRSAWNPLQNRKVDRDTRNARCMQALVESTNRDWHIMSCLLVRRYSEFEAQTVLDDTENISLVDGRKVRWILIYAILQTLISVMQAPKQVRNTEGLTYPLCCHAPKVMPWQSRSADVTATLDDRLNIVPDTAYSHTNTSAGLLGSGLSKSIPKTDRRLSLPSRSPIIQSTRTAPASRSTSLRRMLTKRNFTIAEEPESKQSSFCEIYVQGYGNGLNEIQVNSDEIQKPLTVAKPDATTAMNSTEMAEVEDETPPSLSTTTSVSRESSKASNSSVWSKGTRSDLTAFTPEESPESSLSTLLDILKLGPDGNENATSPMTVSDLQVFDEHNEMKTVHINTQTWDNFLRV